MRIMQDSWQRGFTAGGRCTLLAAALILVTVASHASQAGFFHFWHRGPACADAVCNCPEGMQIEGEVGGTWYWLRSPDEEKRVIMALFNRYCLRCHGVDGRGVWDIPDIPNFADPRWQASRSDAALARIILEGRGAVMPPFRGTLTVEEAWGMARYLRTFVPGTETPRPDRGESEKAGAGSRSDQGRSEKTGTGPRETLPAPAPTRP